MQLHQFKNDKGATTISADQLDENFRRLRPLATDGPSRQYAVTETPEGWKLTLFVDKILSDPTNEDSILAGLQLVEVERCDGMRMRVLGTGWYSPT
jgi:hypothetical protein